MTTRPARPVLSPFSINNSGSQVTRVKNIKDCRPINMLTCQANLDFQTFFPVGFFSSLATNLSFFTWGIQTISVSNTSTAQDNREARHPYATAKGIDTPVPMAANKDNPVV